MKSCDSCTANTRAYRLTVQELFKEKLGNSSFKNEGIHRDDELRYEYYKMEIPCPLCEWMISRFRMAQRQLSNKRKAIHDTEKQQQNPIHIVELMEHMTLKHMMSTSHDYHNQQTYLIFDNYGKWQRPLKFWDVQI